MHIVRGHEKQYETKGNSKETKLINLFAFWKIKEVKIYLKI